MPHLSEMVDPERLRTMKAAEVSELLGRLMDVETAEAERRWERYRPLKSQARFHKSQAQLRAFVGGNRSGKTTAGMVEAIQYALGRHPYRTVLAPNHGWVIALDNGVMNDVIIPEMERYLPMSEVEKWNRAKGIIKFRNGSVITFKSCDSGAEKFQSAGLRWAWFDEEPPEDVWRETQARSAAGVPLDIWLTMTPLNGMDWSWDDIITKQKPGHIEVFNASMPDNTHLLETEKRRLMAVWKGTDEEEARMHGAYFQRMGQIYKGFKEDLHVVDPFAIPKNWTWMRCIDPHPRKPCVCVWAALSPRDELYITEEFIGEGTTLISDFARQVKERDGERTIRRKLIDPSSLQGSNLVNKNIRDELRDHGVPTRLANNDRMVGYNRVRERISTPEGPKIFFFKTCPNTWRQVTHLVYEEWKSKRKDRDEKETQRKRDDDLADCVRYLCAERIIWEPDWHSGFVAQKTDRRYTGYN